ncbi:hypothetical protein AYO21_03365 [Fonsecaea monophora]|uniref:Ribosome biogenesis protein NOP53 n=1 Tax=Fonsecaea monophora TaxID=254056 RepID=A0A177FH27_9EURO|nr:hypothetical protein AYO21_03365 [Fonsecaea monophora]KAH0842916.1 60S ribosome subunit biogenesis protein NOP53 [Fonsecaea pedrosoi]OAG42489.1 hypothetical protein AYO21_03365 [Fonsecaea monophora]
MPPTSTSLEAPSQPTQPSRKGKKAWRKNVDITTVTKGLESLRDEIIQHGKPLAEKDAAELFTLDTTGSREEVLRQAKAVKSGHKSRVLKMDEILGRRSAVPALENSKRNKRGLSVAAVTDGVVEPSSKRQKKDWVSKKEVARLRTTLDKTSHLDVENIDNATSSFDLWADHDMSSDAVKLGNDSKTRASLTATAENEYIPKPRAKVAPPTIHHPPIALTSTGQPVRAVAPPDAGQSYNPSFEDWDSLLTREGEKEVQAEQRRLREAQLAAEKQARIDELARQPDPRPEDNPESEWEGFETEDESNNPLELLKRKRPERKTPAQRNKIKRRKEAERLAKHQARMAERQRRGEEIVQALLEQQKQEQERGDDGGHAEKSSTAAPAGAAAEVLLRRKATLGPSRASIPPAPLELVLPDELQDSLRRLRPEGNLLSERFRNILVNGKLEARKPVSYAASRKRRVKVTEKWWSKDFALRV